MQIKGETQDLDPSSRSSNLVTRKREDFLPGLVLTGGGARAAYQAGVLLGMADILRSHENCPFPILTGVSAGAINSSYLASRAAEPWRQTVSGLADLWKNLSLERIFRTNFRSFAGLSTRWLSELGSGAILGDPRSTHLLDSSPLRELLAQQISFDSLSENLISGQLHGFGISVTSYKTGTAITFFDGNSKIHEWTRSARIGIREQLGLDHILASASIPLFFKPIRIRNAFYGDGGVRLTTPLSPAIHLGSSRILAISVRYLRSSEQTRLLNENPEMTHLAISDIAGVLLNSLFLDALESDVERMERINHTQSLLTEQQRHAMNEPLRQIPVLALHPSRDLGAMAKGQIEKFPGLLRYLLKGLGVRKDKGWDLVSYLAFDSSYTERLVDLGCEDALKQKDKISAFFESVP